MSKYRLFYGPYFPAFGLNTGQKKLRIWTLFTIVCYVQCISNDLQVLVILLYHLHNGGTYLKIKFRIESLSKSVFIWIDALSANYFI